MVRCPIDKAKQCKERFQLNDLCKNLKHRLYHTWQVVFRDEIWRISCGFHEIQQISCVFHRVQMT